MNPGLWSSRRTLEPQAEGLLHNKGAPPPQDYAVFAGLPVLTGGDFQKPTATALAI